MGTLLALRDELAQRSEPLLTTAPPSVAPALQEGATVDKGKLRKGVGGWLFAVGPSATEARRSAAVTTLG